MQFCAVIFQPPFFIIVVVFLVLESSFDNQLKYFGVFLRLNLLLLTQIQNVLNL